jgi:hypothetical protein
LHPFSHPRARSTSTHMHAHHQLRRGRSSPAQGERDFQVFGNILWLVAKRQWFRMIRSGSMTPSPLRLHSKSWPFLQGLLECQHRHGAYEPVMEQLIQDRLVRAHSDKSQPSPSTAVRSNPFRRGNHTATCCRPPVKRKTHCLTTAKGYSNIDLRR